MFYAITHSHERLVDTRDDFVHLNVAHVVGKLPQLVQHVPEMIAVCHYPSWSVR
jgi:hypothetical protein